ncbi:hypothetical protein OG389_00755 [Streptomyces sp. NBC_00435]
MEASTNSDLTRLRTGRHPREHTGVHDAFAYVLDAASAAVMDGLAEV